MVYSAASDIMIQSVCAHFDFRLGKLHSFAETRLEK